MAQLGQLPTTNIPTVRGGSSTKDMIGSALIQAIIPALVQGGMRVGGALTDNVVGGSEVAGGKAPTGWGAFFGAPTVEQLEEKARNQAVEDRLFQLQKDQEANLNKYRTDQLAQSGKKIDADILNTGRRIDLDRLLGISNYQLGKDTLAANKSQAERKEKGLNDRFLKQLEQEGEQFTTSSDLKQQQINNEKMIQTALTYLRSEGIDIQREGLKIQRDKTSGELKLVGAQTNALKQDTQQQQGAPSFNLPQISDIIERGGLENLQGQQAYQSLLKLPQTNRTEALLNLLRKGDQDNAPFKEHPWSNTLLGIGKMLPQDSFLQNVIDKISESPAERVLKQKTWGSEN